MLIQDAPTEEHMRQIEAGQHWLKALAACQFREKQFALSFVEELHRPFYCGPMSEQELIRLFAVIGFAAVVRYAAEHRLGEEQT